LCLLWCSYFSVSTRADVMHFSKIEGISYSVVKVQVRGDPNLWRVETSLKLALMCLVLLCPV